MSNRPFNLPETKGSFQLQGTVLGMQKESAFSEMITKTKKKMRFTKFGVSTSKDNTVYLDLNGMVRDAVYFGKKNQETGKYETKKVNWEQRNSFNEEGFRMIGVNLGIEQYIDEAGKKQNKKKILPEFDACEYINNHLKDDAEVFVRGKIEFSSFVNQKQEVSRATKFIPNQISALKSPIDMDADDYVDKSDFTQTIIFIGATKDDSNPEDKKGLIQAKIVTYNTIEDTEFVVRDVKLFQTLSKNLKPYSSIQVHGKIINKALTEEVEVNSWGEANPMDQVNRIYVRELEIRGANPDSIDVETYTKENIEEAIRAINDFGGTTKNNTNDDWGSSTSSNSDDGWDSEEW